VEAVEKKIRGKIRQIAADEANFFQDCCTTTVQHADRARANFM